jgi:NADPH:quinone reductase-like Zn-dependent oxidoreductase
MHISSNRQHYMISLFFNCFLRDVSGNIIFDVVVGVDVILDCMGASYFQRNLDSLNFDGRLFIIGFQGGLSTEADLRPIVGKRLTVQSNTIYTLF